MGAGRISNRFPGPAGLRSVRRYVGPSLSFHKEVRKHFSDCQIVIPVGTKKSAFYGGINSYADMSNFGIHNFNLHALPFTLCATASGLQSGAPCFSAPRHTWPDTCPPKSQEPTDLIRLL